MNTIRKSLEAGGWFTFDECRRLIIRKSVATAKRKVRQVPEAFRRPPSSTVGPGRPSQLYHYLGFDPKTVVSFERMILSHERFLFCGDPDGDIQTAEGGELFAYIRHQIMREPECGPESLRRLCIYEFGEMVLVRATKRVPMPCIEAFAGLVQELKSMLTTSRVGALSTPTDADKPSNLTISQMLDLDAYLRVKSSFPGATEIRLDLTRPPSRRLLIKMPAPTRNLSDQAMNE